MTDFDIAENLGARPDQYTVSNLGMTVLVLLAGAAERDAVQDRDVVFDHGGLADHKTGGMVEEYPAARIGRGIFLDHATGFVVGETAVIEDDVSILHGVTLGGTGKENEDRHPKIRHGVLIGAGAKILGNIEVGHCARIAAGSVVVKPVPHNVTVAGVPAKIVGEAGCAEPSRTMDQMINAIGL